MSSKTRITILRFQLKSKEEKLDILAEKIGKNANSEKLIPTYHFLVDLEYDETYLKNNLASKQTFLW